ncbi:hypothetical protein GCM10027425_12280 [Alteromonas gracilis]
MAQRDASISIPDAARLHGVSTKTIRRMISRGELPAYRFGKRLIRIPMADLEAAMRPIPSAGGGRLAG